MTKIELSKHILVPKHTKVSEREKAELFKTYNISGEELPKIATGDAAIVDLNLKLGDIVKIVRKSPTAGISVFYRVVANV